MNITWISLTACYHRLFQTSSIIPAVATRPPLDPNYISLLQWCKWEIRNHQSKTGCSGPAARTLINTTFSSLMHLHSFVFSKHDPLMHQIMCRFVLRSHNWADLALGSVQNWSQLWWARVHDIDFLEYGDRKHNLPSVIKKKSVLFCSKDERNWHKLILILFILNFFKYLLKKRWKINPDNKTVLYSASL